MKSRIGSRKTLVVPSYCLHKASGQAVVRVGGRNVYPLAFGGPKKAKTNTHLSWRSVRCTEKSRSRKPRL